MMRRFTPLGWEEAGFGERAGLVCRGLIEALTLLLVCAAPWAFGAVHPLFEGALYAGVALLLVLWAARMLLARRVIWTGSAALWCLAALFFSGVLQITPLPDSWLSTISPATAQWCEDLLPVQPEILLSGVHVAPAPLAAGDRISLYPGATRQELVRLLAVLCVFAVVQSNLGTVGALRRLCVAAVINGSLLGLLGLSQFFSSPQGVVYWTFASTGQSYGPFVCRNHFPFYLNMCVGLGLGLLMAKRTTRLSRPAPWLQDSSSLWMSSALALMLASIMVSVSRGGFAALLLGCLVAAGIRLFLGVRMWRLEAAMLALPATAALLGWLGFNLFESRLATLWSGDLLHTEGRLDVWKDTLPLVREFPLWGTGLGTFPYVEPLHRSTPEIPKLFWHHAHNDYLQALIEGGLLRLTLSVAAIAAVFHSGYRACAHGQERAGGALALGAVLGFSTVVFHSFVDFGLHLPAIALLATVLAAHLCALGKKSRGEASEAVVDENADPPGGRWAWAAPLAYATAALLIALVLYREGWRLDMSGRHHLAALRAGHQGDSALKVESLQAAVGLAPENIKFRLELASAYEDAAKESSAHEQRLWEAAAQQHLIARNQNPLARRPHEWLADHAEKALAAGDDPDIHLARARLVQPWDPDVWYKAGRLELKRDNQELAWRYWRRSLEASGEHLTDILMASGQKLSATELIAWVLPGDPRLLVEAGDQLYPISSDEEMRNLFYAEALRHLERQSAPSAADYHLQATLLDALDRPERAFVAYQAALRCEPGQVAWRFAYADLLQRSGQMDEARDQLRTALAHQPQHGPSRRLLETIARLAAEEQVRQTAPLP